MHSPIGRFQTALPDDSNETVRFGFFSCADYTHDFYNAYDRLAHEDVDFVVCLGAGSITQWAYALENELKAIS